RREEHREAPGVRGADQLLRVRSLLVALETRNERERRLEEAVRSLHRSRAFLESSLPLCACLRGRHREPPVRSVQMVIIGGISAMKKRTRAKGKMQHAKTVLRDFALAYPGAREEFPWGERVIKVGKKVFVFLGMPDGDELGLSVKLPASGPMALL